MSELNIFQRVNKVQESVKYVQKDAQITGGGSYRAVSHDQVVSVIRKDLVKNGIVIYPEQLRGSIVIPRNTKEGNKMHLYSGEYAIHFVNIDNPEDRISATVEAHAADSGDKAPGKALTYATKSAILKVFCLETGENDESRGVSGEPYTDAQKDAFDNLINSQDASKFVQFVMTVGPDVYTALSNTGEKGKKTELKTKCRYLEKEGHRIIDDYCLQITNGINNDDIAVIELVDELEDMEKRLVAAKLTPEQVTWIQEKQG